MIWVGWYILDPMGVGGEVPPVSALKMAMKVSSVLSDRSRSEQFVGNVTSEDLVAYHHIISVSSHNNRNAFVLETILVRQNT